MKQALLPPPTPARSAPGPPTEPPRGPSAPWHWSPRAFQPPAGPAGRCQGPGSHSGKVSGPMSVLPSQAERGLAWPWQNVWAPRHHPLEPYFLRQSLEPPGTARRGRVRNQSQPCPHTPSCSCAALRPALPSLLLLMMIRQGQPGPRGPAWSGHRCQAPWGVGRAQAKKGGHPALPGGEVSPTTCPRPESHSSLKGALEDNA